MLCTIIPHLNTGDIHIYTVVKAFWKFCFAENIDLKNVFGLIATLLNHNFDERQMRGERISGRKSTLSCYN